MLTENVKIAYLPSPDASCQTLGNNLVVSGWGKSIIWKNDPYGVPDYFFGRTDFYGQLNNNALILRNANIMKETKQMRYALVI